MTARRRIANVLLGAGAIVFASWLVGAALGGRVVLGVAIGQWSNLRLAVWLVLAAFLLTSQRDVWVERAERFLSSRARWVIPLAFTAWLVTFKVAQHSAFETTSLDLSIFHYAVRHAWADGPGFAWSFNLERSLFSEHFEPIVLLAVPLDIVFRSPFVLLIPEALGVGAGLALAVGCARAYGLRPLLAWLLGAMYATSLTLWQAFLFDFHPEALLPAGIFATLWAFKARKPWLLALAVLFVLSLKEDMAIVLVPAIALAWFDERERWRPALLVSLIAVTWCVVSLKFVIPAARGPGEHWSLFAERYAAWGATPGEAIVAMLTRPLDLVPVLFGGPVVAVMGELGFAPLLDPLGVLASVPALLEQRLTSFETQHLLKQYYGIGPLTLWMVATLRAVRRISLRRGLIISVLVASLPLIWKPWPLAMPQVDAKHTESRRLLAELIPADATISAQTIIVPHLPISERVKLFPKQATEAQYVVLMPDELRWPLEAPEYRELVEALLRDGTYGVIANNGKLVVLKRGAPSGDIDGVRALLPK